MSVHLPPPSNVDLEPGDVLDSSEDDEDQTFDDWVSDSARKPCQSLFEDKTFPSVEECLDYDLKSYGFSLNDFSTKLALDFHKRVRLVNYIRRRRPAAQSVLALQGTEDFFASDEYLRPALEDDPMLQLETDDWSDSEGGTTDQKDPHARILLLQRQLKKAQQDLADYRAFVSDKLDIGRLSISLNEAGSTGPPSRDDDSHYFDSYGANDIHAVMIQDTVRTSTYASYILTNPSLFHDAVVLDVGCGTGILSLFAARSGAARVFAVDASDIADKAREIVKANGLDDIITVIRGKIEDVVLPDGIEKVDIIVSEWMGYALLYESMLDSVLRARDRFLKPGGVMAPSQCKMMFGLCEGSEIYKDHVGFWHDIYGFDLSVMGNDVYDEAIVDVVGPETLVSQPCVVKDLHLRDVTQRQLDFASPFTLTPKVDRKTSIRAFVLYFDAFFTVNGDPVPPDTQVSVVKERDYVVAEVWPLAGKPPPHRRRSSHKDIPKPDRITSFSTGPQSIPTHWKQTIFLLRDPIEVEEESVVVGTFHCKKSETNSRELDVEIHYSVKQNEQTPPGELVVQMYKVR